MVLKRLNIIDLKNNHQEQFGRFVMALKNLEESPDWSRICGIHGDTFKPDDAEVLCPTDPNVVKFVAETGEPVYCKHKVYSFIAWHTPYLYQFELLLNQYNKSSNTDYITLPYIDLTDFSADFTFMNAETITIFYEKKQITIDNPLASAYYYPDGVKTKTTRNGFLSPNTIKEKAQLLTIKQQLNDVMHAETYEKFSSSPITYVKTGNVTTYTPLETPHNSVHDIVGGDGGNMSEISISAFDPIFWLHHCNMDRHFYSWLYIQTDGFKNSIYPKQMTDSVYNATLAPFSKKYPYNNDAQFYTYGWKNATPEYLRIKDTLDFKRYPYCYDIITPLRISEAVAFVELIDIPIPQETVSFEAYLQPNNAPLDKTKHFAGSAVWFGLNREKIHCDRCCVTRTNIKIDIHLYTKQYNITNENIDTYTLVLEGAGRLIKDSGKYRTYTKAQLIGDGSFEICIV